MQRGIRSREPDEAGRQLDAPLGALQELRPDFQFQPTNLLAQGGCAIPSLEEHVRNGAPQQLQQNSANDAIPSLISNRS
jgi:hypothetical protein